MRKYQNIKFFTVFCIFFLIQNLSLGKSNNSYNLILSLRAISYSSEEQMLVYGDSVILYSKDKSIEEKVLLYYADYYYSVGKMNKRDSILSIITADNDAMESTYIKMYLNDNQFFINNGDYKLALLKSNDLLLEAKKLNDTSLIISVLNQIGTIYKKSYKIDSSFYYYTNALELAEKTNNLLAVSNLISNIGALKSDAGKYDEALELYERSFDIADKNNFLWLKRNINNNLATIYLVNKQYGKAKNLLSKLIIEDKKRNAEDRLPVYWLNLASVHYELKEYQEAIKYYNLCKPAFMISDQKVYAQVLYLLLKCYHAIHEDTYAQKNIPKAIEVANKSGALTILKETYLIASIIYESKGDTKKSLTFYKRHKKISDSLIILANQKTLMEMEVKYQVHEKEKEKIKSDNLAKIILKEKEVDSFKYKIYLGTLILVFIFTSIIYILRQKKNRHEKFSQELMKNIDLERNRIALDLHDDIGQLLSLMKNKVHIAISKNVNNLHEVEESISAVIEKTRKISRNLFPAQIKSLGLEKSITNLLQEVENECEIFCTHHIDPIDDKLTLETKTHLFRILQECVSNTIKHSKATAIKFEIYLKDNGMEIIYQDNGVGLNSSISTKGLGILSIRERVKILNGEMNIPNYSKKGFMLKLKFPKI